MKLFVFLALMIVALSATTAMAAGPYIGAAGGVSLYQDTDAFNSRNPFYLTFGKADLSYDPGYAFQLCSGYSFESNIRLEGEVGYKAATTANDICAISINTNGVGANSRLFDDSYLRILSLMANGFYDIKVDPQFPVTPFVGAGLGVLRGSFKDYAGQVSTDTALGYQLSAGASYRVTSAVDLTLSYRFEGAAGGFNFDGTDISYGSNNVLAGVRYTFR